MFRSTLKRYLNPHAFCSLVVISAIQHNQTPPSTTHLQLQERSTTPLQLPNIQSQTNKQQHQPKCVTTQTVVAVRQIGSPRLN
jgi:hypothetical protein